MAQSAGEKIVKAAALLMTLQVLDQLTGLVKQMVIAAKFGTSESMDAYLVAATIVGLIMVWVSLPINQTLIPMFRHDMARSGEGVAWANASTLFNNLAVLLIVIGIIVGLLSPYLVGLVAPGFEQGTWALATSLAQITVASVFFVGAGGILSQIFFSYERFFRPGFVGIADNLVGTAAILALSYAYGIYGLAVAVVLGAAANFALQLPILWEKRQFYSAQVNLRHPGMIEMGKLSFPLLISAGGAEVAKIIDRMFASLLPGGSLSALAFAQRLTSLQYDFLVRPLQRSTYPHFAKLTAEGDFSTLSRQLFRYIRLVFFLALPVAIGIMIMAESVVRVLFQRGAFDETSVRLTSQALLFYAIGSPAAALSRILDRTFFSMKDTRTPTKLALLRIGIKILLAFLLIKPLAHVGIALAESISQVIRVPFLFFSLPREIRRQEGWKTVGSFSRTLIAAILMGFVIYVVDSSIDGLLAMPLEVAGLVLLGTGIFGVVAFVLLNEESQTVLNALSVLGARLFPKRS